MSYLTNFGISRSRLTWLVIVGLLLQGLWQYASLSKREDPAVTSRTVVVTASSRGLSTERVENLLVIPIERKAREIGEIDDINSLVLNGQAIVNLAIANSVPEAELQTVFQEIRNKMAPLEEEFPAGTRGPNVNSDYGDVVITSVAVTGEGFTHAERETAAKALQSHLYTIEGVAKVSLFGVQEERILLEFDSRKLAAIGVQIPTLLDDLQAQNVVLPAGEIDAGGTKLVLEANGDLSSVAEIENVLTKVSGLGGYVRLKDLLTVSRTYQNPSSKPVFYNGQPAVMVAVEMLDGQDIQRLGKHIRKEVLAHESQQPIGIAYAFSTYQEEKVTQSINSALSNVAQTFLVVLVIMLIFLGWRSALIIASIVPLSVAFSLIGMGQMGISLEQVSIAAVIISLGLLVDNGLVVVEDMQTRVSNGVVPKEAALNAGKQFFLPLAVASVTTVSAFIPMMILDGTEGEFAFSLGAVVALMLAGSWFTAMYILPALGAWLITPSKPRKRKHKNPWYVSVYQQFIKALLPWSLAIVVACYALVVLSVTLLFPQLKSEMFPMSERNQYLIYMDMPKGTAISETQKVALRVDKWLGNESINPEVSGTTLYVGDGGPRFYLSLNPADSVPSSAFFLVNTKHFDGTVDAAKRAQQYFIEQFPEARFKVKRLSMGGSESGIVELKLTGPDADELLRRANDLEHIFSSVPGIVQNENDWGNKVLKIVINVAQDKARELGVTSQSLSETLDGYFSGSKVSEFRDGDKLIPINVRAEENYRNSIEDVANLTIAAGGRLISLDQVANIQPALDYSQIRRENQQRQITVSAKSDSFTAAELLRYIQPKLDAIDYPPGYAIDIAGEVEQSAEVNAKLGAGAPLALSVMLLALMLQFNSLRRVVVTFMTIPLITIGAPVVLLLLGRPLSFFAILGMISLAGIIINNAIVMIDQIDIERKTADLKTAIVRAVGKRITPVMLTSLTTVFGLIPMAVAGGALFEPMATLMIGGLIVASVLTLFFVPSTYYLLFHRQQNA